VTRRGILIITARISGVRSKVHPLKTVNISLNNEGSFLRSLDKAHKFNE